MKTVQGGGRKMGNVFEGGVFFFLPPEELVSVSEALS